MLEFLCATAIFLAEPASRPSPAMTTTDARLVAIDEAAQQIHAISADFTQEKQSPLLTDPIITRGTLKAVGSSVLWTASEPEPTQTQVSTSQLRIYYPRQKLVEEYALTDSTAALTASPLPKLAALQQSFEIELDAGDGLPRLDGTLALRLTPRDPELSKYVDQIRVLLDTERAVVVAFEMTDPDGEITLTRFENIRVNPDITEADVALQLPGDVKHVSPAGRAK